MVGVGVCQCPLGSFQQGSLAKQKSWQHLFWLQKTHGGFGKADDNSDEVDAH
jgi:hypothetical protein